MKKIFCLLKSLFIVSIVTAQFLRPQQSLLITIGVSESNGPAYGRNFLASTAEKAQRRARIYQVETNKFDRLHISAANNLGTFDTTHGFELQLANALDSGYFGDYNLYLNKPGQGSTRAHDWMPGSALYERMIEWTDNSIALIYQERGVVPSLWMPMTIGINDNFAGLSSANFRDSINIILDSLHAYYPSMKFIFTKFNQPSYTSYNTTFDAIATARSSYVFTVYDATAELRADNTHWDYEGLKKLARQMTTIIQAND